MNDVPQVTCYDIAANALATWRETLPTIVTALAYHEAVQLSDALLKAIEAFEKSAAFKRLTGAQ